MKFKTKILALHVHYTTKKRVLCPVVKIQLPLSSGKNVFPHKKHFSRCRLHNVSAIELFLWSSQTRFFVSFSNAFLSTHKQETHYQTSYAELYHILHGLQIIYPYLSPSALSAHLISLLSRDLLFYLRYLLTHLKYVLAHLKNLLSHLTHLLTHLTHLKYSHNCLGKYDRTFLDDLGEKKIFSWNFKNTYS